MTVGHQDFTRFDEAHRDGAGHGRTITAFGQHELTGFQIGTAVLQKCDEGHTGEFTAGQHAVCVLHRGDRHIAPLHAGIGATFDEMKSTDRGQAHQIVHGEHLGRFHQTVDHETMLGRIDVPPALVMTFEMQATGRDDAKQRLQGRKRH